MYLELGEQGGAGVEVAPRAREVEPRELADRLLQFGIHGLRGSVSLAGFSFFLAGGDDAARMRRTEPGVRGIRFLTRKAISEHRAKAIGAKELK